MENSNSKIKQFWAKYIWIILTPIFKFFKDIFFVGVNYRNSFITLKLPPTNTQQYLSKHIYIHKLISYLFTFIVYSIKNCITTGTWFSSFNQNIQKPSDKKKNTSNSKFLLIIFLWIVEETLNEIFKGMLDLEFWMFGLIFIWLLTKKNIKKHHIFSNCFILIICSILKIILIIIDANEDDKKDIINKNTPWYFIVSGIIIYLFIIFIRAIVYVNLKSFMDESFISPSKILIFYGLIGIIISFIVCLISTLVECNYDFLKNYICAVSYIKREDYNNNSNIKYFENFSVYYKTLKGEINNILDKENLGLELFLEIFIVILIGNAFFLPYKYFFMRVIQDLSPGHAIFSYSINKIIPKIILPIFTLGIKGSYFLKEPEKNIMVKYILGFINNIFATIGFAIYLEMIILHFCDLDHDTNENIMKRGCEDINSSELVQGINDNDSEEDEENKEENNGVI